jgi:hypothetical protein
MSKALDTPAGCENKKTDLGIFGRKEAQKLIGT